MVKIDIDGKKYDLDELSDEAKTRMKLIQFCDEELGQLQAEIAVIQAARMAYAHDLKGELAKLNGEPVVVEAPEIKIEKASEIKIEPPFPLEAVPAHHLGDLIEQPFTDLSGPPSFGDEGQPSKKGRLLGRIFKK